MKKPDVGVDSNAVAASVVLVGEETILDGEVNNGPLF